MTKTKKCQPKPTPSSVFGSYTKGGSSYQSNWSPNYGGILVYNKINILACSSRIMHVIHTNQKTTHISLGSRQGDWITLGTMFGVIGVLKKGIWSMNEIKSMVDCVKDLEFCYQEKWKKMLGWQVYMIEENSETLELNDEDEGIDLNSSPNIETWMIEENATPLK